MTGNYFQVLGVAPAYGRAFAPDETVAARRSTSPSSSYSFWQNRLGAAPSAIGREINLNGSPYVVIGVAPPGFVGPGSVEHRTSGCRWRFNRKCVRRPPGCAVRSAAPISSGARAALALRRRPRAAWRRPTPSGPPRCDVLARRLQEAYPQTNRPRAFHAVRARRGTRACGPRRRPMLYLLAVAVALVLLIACANVTEPAGGTLGFTASRNGGPGRGRRQPLAADPPVADRIGAAGAARRHLRAAARPLGAPLLHLAGISAEIALDVNYRVLAFTFAVAAASGLLSELAPVLHTLRGDTISALRDEGGAVATGIRAARWRRGVRRAPGGDEPDAAGRCRPVPAHAPQRQRHRPRLRNRFDDGGRYQPGCARVQSRRPVRPSTGRSSIACGSAASPPSARRGSRC